MWASAPTSLFYHVSLGGSSRKNHKGQEKTRREFGANSLWVCDHFRSITPYSSKSLTLSLPRRTVAAGLSLPYFPWFLT